MRFVAPMSRGLALAFALVAWPAAAQTPAGTAFTYQGRLSDAGSPASGSFDFQFALFDAPVGGGQVGATLDVPALNVTTGLFTASLDFGALAFGASARWLEVRVRPAGAGGYTTLAARQRITAGPNALFASNADLLDGLTSTQLLRSDQNGTLTGTLAVNSGTTAAPGFTFLGDTDTGLFRPAADQLALAAGGSQIAIAGTFGFSATATSVGGVGVRGTGPGTVLGDGVFGTTSSGGRGVVAQNTSSGIALLASSISGDHLVASTSTGVVLDPLLRVTNAGSILSEGTLAAGHTIAPGTPGPSFNAFGNSANKDEAAISASNDVYVEGGLEVDGAGFVDGNLHLGGQSDTDNDNIFFDTGQTESLTWDNAQNQFVLSSGLKTGWLNIASGTVGASNFDFVIAHRDDVDVMIDDDEDGVGDAEWWRQFHDPPTNGNQLAALRSGPTAADRGDFLIRGQLTTGFAFDVAERFRRGDDVEPGELVRIDPVRSDAVLRTRGEGDAAVLGVVSTDPALLIGGTTFDVAALRAWGEDLEQEFRTEQAALEDEILTEQPGLRLRLERARTADPPLARGRSVGPVEQVQGSIAQRALERFASRRLAAVALAGRVPVNVDASLGEIQVGDLLAPSPVPGVAMKATKAGPIVGTALEAFSGGRGQVLMFVHRGHYSPPPETDERDRLIATLEERIERLERALASRLREDRP